MKKNISKQYVFSLLFIVGSVFTTVTALGIDQKAPAKKTPNKITIVIEENIPDSTPATCPVNKRPTEKELQALDNAQAWLLQIDSLDYKKACDQLNVSDKTREFSRTRLSLGKVLDRKWQGLQPKSPDMEYETFVFHTSFEHKEDMVETVTMKKTQDGAWAPTEYNLNIDTSQAEGDSPDSPQLTAREQELQEEQDSLIIQSAEAWLALVDQQNYEESYREMVGNFPSIARDENTLEILKTDSLENWKKLISLSRKPPFGKLVSRECHSMGAIPDPAGNGSKKTAHIILTFYTHFEGNKHIALEYIVMRQQPDGTWKPATYRIRSMETPSDEES